MVPESLEDRRLFSVALNAAGWTVVTPSSTAHKVYVSSAHGSDKNSGLTTSAPVATLAAGYALLRAGTDDELLLERGDTWTTSFPGWAKSGASATSPMVIGTYGTGNRPVIDTGSGSGLIANARAGLSYLVLQGINFIANARDPALGTVTAAAAAAFPMGLQILGPGTGITVEDASFTYFGDGVDIQGFNGLVSNVTIRRSNISSSYCTSTHSEGLYAENLTGLTLDQDVFDHNGWNASVAGAVQTVFDHDVYAYSTVTGLTVTNSVISNAAFAGIMARGGGVIDNNLFLNNAIGVSYGGANGAASTVGGVKGNIENNVFLGDHSVGTLAYGEGVEIDNTARGATVTVSGNVFAGDTQHVMAAIGLAYAYATTNAAATVGLNNVTVADNVIHGWNAGLSLSAFTDGGTGLASLNGLKVTGNQVQDVATFGVLHANAYSASAEAWSGNTYSSVWAASQWFYMGTTNTSTAAWKAKVEPTATFKALSYVAPNRTAATYAATLGRPATADAFVAAAAAQSDLSWTSTNTAAAVIAYVKAGFALAGTAATNVALAQLTGTTIGTAGSYYGSGSTIAKATDGSLSTYFDGPAANGNWVGLDLSADKSIQQISFAPRAGYASRMVSGVFQVSTSANFTTGVTTVYSITTAPATGSLTTVTLSAPVTGRYVRYLSPSGSYGDVAEVQFYG